MCIQCSSIEKELRFGTSNDKRVPIYTPAGYIDKITHARKNQPYGVKYLTHEFVKDFASLNYYDSIRPGKRVGDPHVTDIRVLSTNLTLMMNSLCCRKGETLGRQVHQTKLRYCIRARYQSRRQNTMTCNTLNGSFQQTIIRFMTIYYTIKTVVLVHWHA